MRPFFSREVAKAAALAAAFVASAACARSVQVSSSSASSFTPRIVAPDSGERHLANIRQLTNGGENAEAYFSHDGTRLIFQSTRDGRTCDQQYIMNVDGTGAHRVSNGQGKTTCGFFMNGDRTIFFASSDALEKDCPPRPDPSQGYVWRLDPFDIYTANDDGTNIRRLTSYGVYTAEGVLSPDGTQIVFTSLKDGDLDIYVMNVDGTNVRRLTNLPGYDGGPWWSPDGKRIAYRAYHPTDSTELAQYRALLDQRLVRPNKMELWMMNADGSDQHQVTSLGGANFGPSWTPDGRQLIFSSNYRNPHSGNFDLYLIDANARMAGANAIEQITTSPVFDGFPMFSPDGKQLVWASNRHDVITTETNLFVADWVP